MNTTDSIQALRDKYKKHRALRVWKSRVADDAIEKVMRAIHNEPTKTIVFVLPSTYMAIMYQMPSYARFVGDFPISLKVLGVNVTMVTPTWWREDKVKFKDIIWCL